jgi:5-methyltetrahydrofolate--homocysteine methyltransferase
MVDYEALMKVIQEGKFGETQTIVKSFLGEGEKPEAIIENGIIPALDTVGRKFSEGECFIPEMLIAAKASQICLGILKPLLLKTDYKPKGKIVIGTVKGDLHDIGKNIVAMMLEAGGFQVIDLGIDVAPERFTKTAEAEKADILALSCLLTTTMRSMEETMQAVRKAGLYGKVKVMIGGPPTTDDFAKKIGANFRGDDAYKAVQQARLWVE